MTEKNFQRKAPGIFRILIAIVYDALLIVAVLFFATAIALPFNSGEAFESGQFLFALYLLLTCFLFYGWFWTHGGQTLGLKSWKMTLLTRDGRPISWRHAALRFLASLLSWSCLGLGFLWMLFDKDKLSWHDKLSGTALFMTNNDK